MANVTISVDDDTARWVRIEAAKAGLSVSRYVGAMLAERRLGAGAPRTQAAAIDLFLSGPALGLTEAGRAPARESLYDRESLHRYQRADLRARSSGKRKGARVSGVAEGAGEAFMRDDEPSGSE